MVGSQGYKSEHEVSDKAAATWEQLKGKGSTRSLQEAWADPLVQARSSGQSDNCNRHPQGVLGCRQQVA